MNSLKSAVFVFFAVLLAACGDNRLKVNISSIKEDVTMVRFDEELFSLGTAPTQNQLNDLHHKYPDFTDLYTYKVLRIGGITDSTGWALIHEFLSDSTTRKLKRLAEINFGDLSHLQKELVRAFKHYRYYFPEKPLPVIYFCISGFNESVFTAEKVIGISLDKYLGSGCEFYSLLDLPLYKQRKMIPAMISSDVVYTWGMTEFDISPEATTLLDHIIHQGKLMYFTEALLPGVQDTLRTGFTAQQLKWCQHNEAQMWNYLVEKHLLFSTQQMDIVRYIKDGPTTNGFPPESPGRTGAWLGRQIIRSYMKRNPDISLSRLMTNQNYQQILNTSAYAPQ